MFEKGPEFEKQGIIPSNYLKPKQLDRLKVCYYHNYLDQYFDCFLICHAQHRWLIWKYETVQLNYSQAFGENSVWPKLLKMPLVNLDFILLGLN